MADYNRTFATLLTVAGALFLLTALLLFAYRTLPRIGTAILLLLGLPLGTYLLRSMSTATCYAVQSFSRRSTAVSAQRDLLRKYRDSGVLSEQAYQRSLAGLQPETMLKSASQPARED